MITVAGEVLTDLLIDPLGSVTAVAGGAPFNVARNTARLGGDCRIVDPGFRRGDAWPRRDGLRSGKPRKRGIWPEHTPGRVRYVARKLRAGLDPHTVVTSDLGELRCALEPSRAPDAVPEEPPAGTRDRPRRPRAAGPGPTRRGSARP